MIGLSFKIPNEWGSNLYKIFESINIENGIWKIEEDEVFDSSGEFFFKDILYDNDKFFDVIQNSHYIAFVKITLYDKYVEEKIENYNDFQNSNCILSLFITDSIYVQLYCKNLKILEKVRTSVENNNFNDLKVITINNNTRKKFSSYAD